MKPMTPFFALFLLCAACRQTVDYSQPVFALSPETELLFLDSTAASVAITQDTMTEFFQRLRPLDMHIQMKQSHPVDSTQSRYLQQYLRYIAQDVVDFSTAEKRMLHGVFKQAYHLAGQVNGSLFPERVQLIKTKGRHFGNSAFYTRNRCIIIPANELEEAYPQTLLQVMLHELSHLYTRYHPERAEELYQLVGFSPLDLPLQLPDTLSCRLLLNPDGVDHAYGIRLLDGNRPLLAVPIIRSNETSFQPHKQLYFQYLQFDLYETQLQGDVYTLLSNPDGSTTLNWKNNETFYQQITHNTDYIIHPDEIVAENFMMLLLSQNDKHYLSKLQPDGKILLDAVERVLKKETAL